MRPSSHNKPDTVSKQIGWSLYRAQRNQIEREIFKILNKVSDSHHSNYLIMNKIRPLLWHNSYRRFYNPAQMIMRAIQAIIEHRQAGNWLVFILNTRDKLNEQYYKELADMSYAPVADNTHTIRIRRNSSNMR